jgi:hypothetical protein
MEGATSQPLYASGIWDCSRSEKGHSIVVKVLTML